MTDDEILARLPHLLHPYLVRPLAFRLLRPVEFGSPEFNFAVSLLYVIERDSLALELSPPAAKPRLVPPSFSGPEQSI